MASTITAPDAYLQSGSSPPTATAPIRVSVRIQIVPLHLWQSNEIVARLHRHHKPVRVAKFSIGCEVNGVLVGAAICMRPACRSLDNDKTLEVCRLVTDGTPNACSALYGACARIAKEMGYEKIQTYILDSEPGTSLKAAGWSLEATSVGGTNQGRRRNRPNGHGIYLHTFLKKQRWVKYFVQGRTI
jgi:hypothetical protein